MDQNNKVRRVHAQRLGFSGEQHPINWLLRHVQRCQGKNAHIHPKH